ncbi:MAG: DUF4349 domain-containing protein [Chloroflexota bacterium]|nr:DUF4349 domain-containing protein [Chloroflexota bacterium]
MHTPNGFRGSRRRLAGLGVVVVVLGAAACSGANLTAPAATTAPPQPADAPMGKAAQPLAPPAASPVTAASSTATDASTAQSLDRMVIRTAQLTVEVANMEEALAQARQIASRGGGIVSASNTHIEKVNDQDRMVADLTLQVRSDAADGAMSELRALGKVTTEAGGSQDVTEEYVDLGSNLRNLQASEAAILKLMDKATQIQDVLQLQRELTNVRGQIERIQGRKTYLERRSDMATITLSLRLPPLNASAQPFSGAWDPAGVAQRGWQASLALLRGVAEVVIVVVAFSWWLVPFVALGAYVWLHRRRTPTPTPAATTGQA